MYVADILNAKGTEVISTGPTETVAATANLLNDRRIGAVIVRDAKDNVIGVVSERDIIRGIALNGASALDMEVRDLMTSEVVTCKPTDTISEVMRVMTTRRFRHLPVMEDGALKGMISIGDVVKYRLEETEMEARVLRDYVIASR
jgi:CBS domain-containing protein